MGTQRGEASGDTAERPSRARKCEVTSSELGLSMEVTVTFYCQYNLCYFQISATAMSREPQVLHHQTAADVPCLPVALSTQRHPSNPYGSHGPQIHKLPSLTLSSHGEKLFLGLRMYFLSWCPFSLLNSSIFFKSLFCFNTRT